VGWLRWPSVVIEELHGARRLEASGVGLKDDAGVAVGLTGSDKLGKAPKALGVRA